MINGYRVRQARELAGLTQADLASQIGIAQSTVAHIEGGRFQPSDEVVSALATRLNFPVPFFGREDPPNFPLGSLLFRAHADISAVEKGEAHRYGQLMYEISLLVGKKVKNKTPLRLPQIHDNPPDPISAAQLTRDVLGIPPDMPIPHLIRAVEQIGVLVFALPERLENRDAYSLWNRFPTLWSDSAMTRPVIVLSGDVSGDRLRHSVAHELGHLVIHQSLQGKLGSIEKDAGRFASELLMPEATLKEKVLPPVTLTSLASLKPKWGISIQSLMLRAKDADIINYRQYRYLLSQLRMYGWETQEPMPIEPEKPRAIRQMLELVYGNPIDYQRFASDLDLDPIFAKRLIEAHATREEYARRTVKDSDGIDRTPIPFARRPR